VICQLVIGLALRGADADPLAPWLPAGAVLAVSLVFAALAAWHQHEGWALASGLGVNLAASLVVAYFQQTAGWGAWWMWLLQANVIASSATTLIWLAVRQQLFPDRREDIDASPL